MDYKDFFNRAVSAAYRRYTFSDSSDIIRSVKERANGMEKNNEKKKSRILPVLAGTAAAVAVIGAGVFGVNMLNTYGGLKGPDVQGGAGYHEEVTEPAETTAVTTNALIATEDIAEPKDILQSVGDVLEFSDMTAKISKYDYDGQFLRVMVEAEYHKPISDGEGIHRLVLHIKDFEKYDVSTFCLNDYKYVTAKYYQEIAEMIRNDPNVENWDEAADMDTFGRTLMYDIGTYIRLDPGQTAELEFEYLPAEGTAREFAGNYTLTGIDTTDALCTVTNSLTDTTFTVSKWGALVEGPYDLGELGEIENFSLAVKYKDGTEKMLADRGTKSDFYPSDDIPYYEFPSYYTDLGRGRDYIISSIFMEGKIDVENIAAVVINGEEIGTDIDPDTERESSIRINFNNRVMSGIFEFTYYIDGELQPDMTETRDMSEEQRIEWNVKGSGVHKYEIFIRNTDTDASGKMLDMDIDFSKNPPEKIINDETFDPKVFRELIEQGRVQGDLSQIEGIYPAGYEFPYDVIEGEDPSGYTPAVTLPDAVANGNGLYGEFLDTPLIGDEAWELVKERGGIDFDFPLPYDKSLFVFDGCQFYINYADCDVTAFVGGTVEYAGWCSGYGLAVLIHDENGHYWFWGHLSEVSAAEGDTVSAGDVIGHTGSTGYAFCQCYAMRVG